MTTDQLYRARLALGELYDICDHVDSEIPLTVSLSLERIDKWLEHGHVPANARRRLRDDAVASTAIEERS